MAFLRGGDDAEPLGRGHGATEIRHADRTGIVAAGTLACPACDAPVSPARALSPAEHLACPFCGHGGAVRDFLSLGLPTRPAHVVVRVSALRPRVERRRPPVA